MRRIFILLDIFAAFIITIFFISLIIGKKQTEQNFQPFSGVFSSPSSVLPDTEAIKNYKNQEEYCSRKFRWTDSKNQIRNTVVNIKKSNLKKEINLFGLSKGMTDSLFLKRRGFIIIKRRDEMINGQLVEKVKFIVDYKKIFKRNIPYFTDLTKQLIASIPYKNLNPLYTFLKFVQYIPYKRSPTHYSGRFINKFFVPLVCLYESSGDCDSKSLLLSELLATYPKSEERMGIVLVYGQGIAHALLAIKKKPLIGMSSLLVRGDGYYILLETTHPRWSPGFISYRVRKAIKAGFIRFIALN